MHDSISILVGLFRSLPVVQDFINGRLEATGCTAAAKNHIQVAAEEIFVNIAHYAYAPEIGRATVRVEVSDNPVTVTITFIDQGQPFDPLTREDPDVTLSADERGIGGLGIFLSKKIMDDVTYEYTDGRNILTLKKDL